MEQAVWLCKSAFYFVCFVKEQSALFSLQWEWKKFWKTQIRTMVHKKSNRNLWHEQDGINEKEGIKRL